MAVQKKSKTTRNKKTTRGKKTNRKNTRNKSSTQKSKHNDDIILLIVIAVSLLLFISIYTIQDGIMGYFLHSITFGMVGIISYIIPFYLIFSTIFLLANKGITLAYKKIIYSLIILFILTIIAQIVQGQPFEEFTSFIECFNYSIEEKKAGGLIGGIFAYILIKIFGKWGTYIVLTISLIVFNILITEKSIVKLLKRITNKSSMKFKTYLNKEKKSKKKQKNNNFTIQHYEEDDEEKAILQKEKTKKGYSKDNEKDIDLIPINSNKEQLSFDEIKKTNNNSTVVEDKKEINIDDSINIQNITSSDNYTYDFPSLELLNKQKNIKNTISKQMIVKNANKLQKTLENFGVKVKVLNVSCGPSVTRYELQPEQGVKVSKIVNLIDDIKLNMAAQDIRIEAPIPGKAAIGIEVPNKENQVVYIRDIIESEEFQKHSSKVAFAIGKDIAGNVIIGDIAKMPHLLIAGATGSGKSVCINTLITSIIYKAKPSEVKLIMIDPKMVELSIYNGIPHLLIPVVTDPKKASSALSWGVAEMTDRYKKFAEYNVRDMKGYNEKVKDIEEVETLPQIVIIVDELADLMMVAPNDVEDAICRLAQMARAAGIHLVIATQRPSVNVITGVIKANIPSRIAFSVSSGTDSRTIIDMNGAERLLGKGDMLFYPVGYQKPVRIQGAFISDKEVNDIVDSIKTKEETKYNEKIMEQITTSSQQRNNDVERDEYFEEAVKLVVEKQKASISMLQRIFRIGFNRASRLMEQLYEAGIVGAEEGSKPRKVLKTKTDLINEENNN